MAHLVTDLGQSYVTDFFSGAYFVHEGTLHKFVEINRSGNVVTYEINGSPLADLYTYEPAILPQTVLESFTKFSWPKMGYRNVRTSNELIFAPYIQSGRSTKRGLMDENTMISYDNASLLAQSAMYDTPNRLACIYQVFFPVWFSYNQALAMLRDNKAVSVALNEEVAITHCLDPMADDSAFSVLFRGREVGVIRKNGAIDFKNKKLTQMNLFRNLLSKS